MSGCLVCGGITHEVMSFGRMPLGNGFLRASDFAEEYFWNLSVVCCPRCSLVQLNDPVDKHRMFSANYAFFSSTSTRMAAHFQRLAESLRQVVPEKSFVVELGSNDGSLLQHLSTRRTRVLGVDPSTNVAAVAADRGLPTLARFFDESCARDIVAEHGHADAVVGTNVFCHVPNIGSVLEGCDLLLRRHGVVMLEDPYWGDIVDNTAYDQIYDEHAFYFTGTSVSRLASCHGFELIDVRHFDVHGGSMRYVLGKAGAHAVSDRVEGLLAREAALGLTECHTFDEFRAHTELSRARLLDVVQDLRRNGARIAGYAATSKSTTVLNYCGIGPDVLEYVSDSTPAKQRLYTPGVHIPIRSPEHFRTDAPHFALLFAWNHAAEISEKEKAFTEAGRRWITYVPRVVVAPVPVAPGHALAYS